MNDHANLLMNEGDVEGALSLWHEGSKLNCNDAIFSLARHFDKEGERLEALKHYVHAANLGNMHAPSFALKAADAASISHFLDDAAVAQATVYTLEIMKGDFWLGVG